MFMVCLFVGQLVQEFAGKPVNPADFLGALAVGLGFKGRKAQDIGVLIGHAVANRGGADREPLGGYKLLGLHMPVATRADLRQHHEYGADGVDGRQLDGGFDATKVVTRPKTALANQP